MRNDLLGLLGGLFLSGGGGQTGEIENRATQVDSDTYNYQIYVPAKLRNQSNPPVIIFLHGIRERGTGGFVPTTGPIGMFVRRYFEQAPAIILLPQCRQGSYWSDPAMDKMVMQALAQTVKEFEADENRIYLTGVSMGGYGVWHFASQYPGKFAALVPICGGSSLMSGDRFSPVAQKIGKTPAWVFHGAEDKIVPVTESRQMVEALNKIQGNVKYSEYAGVGHEVWLNVLKEKKLMPWLLAQRLGEQVSA
jgi:predicted peptidase